ncbi:uncharacterized protein LOC133193241 [Saccostrea echinata]|uniref:uncharacterized protein LOC133193241 n=1 Tax=Saccostrea echinata TaxID=191078 RepID=UPI002A7F0E8F|nr:uncharacterized protein LOC133193241 [Saccostrea echinata]
MNHVKCVYTGKEKLDSAKRPKTGGGPPQPPLTAEEETFLRLSESEPSVSGVEGGIDTDAPTFQVSEVNESQLQSAQQGSQCQEQTSNGKDTSSSVDYVPRMVQNVKRKEKTGEAKRRKLEELDERNLILDSQRLKIKEERECLALKKEVLLLKKQKLLCEIQSSYPDFITALSSEL